MSLALFRWRQIRFAPIARMFAAAAVSSAMVAPALDAQGATSIAFEKFTLPNGLEVILHVDKSVPIVAVNSWYKVGSGDEKPGRTGFAHLFEHVMFMGSKNVPERKFDGWLEAAGASNNGSTSEDRTNYYETGPSNALPLMLWLDADRMGWLLPTMDKPKLDLQRDVVKNERRERVENSPYGRVFETLLPVMYPKTHPYSWPVVGSMQDLSSASVEDVSEFFRKYYAPNNASIAIAGDIDPKEVKKLVTKYFGEIPRNPDAPVRPTAPPAALTKDTVIVLEDRVQLPRMYYVWHGVKAFSADEPALEALCDIIAGGKSSRLYKSLVYEKQVAQDVGMGTQFGKLDGMVLLSATAKPGQHPRVLAGEIDATIAKVAAEGITERELTQVKNGMRARLLDATSSVLGKADQLNFYNYFVGNPDYLAQDLARYEKLTRADVQRVAKDYVQGKPKIILTVVPEGKKNLALVGGTK
ncbi:MAG: insulinase family protein [Phycisphaerae bacterium]|nr:insulinase family protein [Gemmatimonadaceae bacterium]